MLDKLVQAGVTMQLTSIEFIEFNVNKSIIQYLKRKATLNSAKITSIVCGEAMEKMEK